MSRENLDIGDSCFVAYIILGIIEPKEIPQGHLGQEIFVIVLNLNAEQISVNKKHMEDQNKETHLYCLPRPWTLTPFAGRHWTSHLPEEAYCWCPSSTLNRAAK
jgi:hypothetical protein